MSLIKYGIAAALGYHLGQPQGRKQLQQLRQQVIQLSRRPEVKQLQDNARDRALAAKDRAATTLTRKKDTVDPAPADPTAPTSTQSPVIPPPPVGRTTPPSPAPRP